MDKIINNLPSSYKKDTWIQMLMKTAQIQLDELEQNAIQLGNELLLNLTSEKQLAVEEKLCGITPTLNQNIDDRKAIVSAKWKVNSPVTLKTLQAIADGWEDGEVVVSYPNSTHVRLDFEREVEDFHSMLNAIREIMPAHLLLFASVLYNNEAPIYTANIVQQADNITVFTAPNTVNDKEIYTANITQLADNITVFTPPNTIDEHTTYFASVVQIADNITALTTPNTADDKEIYTANIVQVVDNITALTTPNTVDINNLYFVGVVQILDNIKIYFTL